MTPLPPIGAVPAMPFGPLGAGAASGLGAAAEARAPGGADAGFGDMLTKAVAGLNSQMVGSERLSEQAAVGKADTTEALVAVEQADLMFTTAVQVRNKLVEGWQELSRMQV
ncbi:flagellar hook-basal body complex protein FliE [Miltoncostaea marina]|uniref:flagellar hook-basal body complex protein FliE n=1 Tax=Miltoncostaea marina TaxID=2843215 RepID=UPI001C3E0A42|nr:flagellar hook-basal body complex protein FliE [Miltoncostaea marina]